MARRPVGVSHLALGNFLCDVSFDPQGRQPPGAGYPRRGFGLVTPPPGDALILTVREEINLNGFQIDFQPVFQ